MSYLCEKCHRCYGRIDMIDRDSDCGCCDGKPKECKYCYWSDTEFPKNEYKCKTCDKAITTINE